MGAYKNEAIVDVTLNGAAAERELQTLQGHMKKLIELRDRAMKEGDVAGYNKLNVELKKATKEAGSLEKQMKGVDAVMKNLSGSSLKELKEAQSVLEKQVTHWKRGTAEHTLSLQKLKQVNGEISSIRKEMYATETGTKKWGAGMGNLLASAKGLLPAFGFGMIVAGASAAFQKIVSATDTLSDKWDQVMGGMTAATNYFWSTLASGDWSNFFSNITEAARLGAKYAETLDNLADRQRALTIEEADAQQRILDLELKIKNKTLSREERMKAGEERIKLEEELTATREKNAQLALDNEIQNNIKLKSLGLERTKQILTDLDSQERLEADAYNAKVSRLDELKKLQKIQNSPQAQGTTLDFNVDPAEIKRLNAEIGATPGAIKDYAGALTQFGKVTDAEKDRIVKTYTDLKSSQNSAVENTKKVRTQVNSLLAGERTEQKRAGKDAVKQEKENMNTILKALDEAYQERLLKIEQLHIVEMDSEENFQLNMKNAEHAYLQQKMAVMQEAGLSTIEIQRQLLQQQLQNVADSSAYLLNLQNEIFEEFRKLQEKEAQKSSAIQDKEVDEMIRQGEAARATLISMEEEKLSRLEKQKEMYFDMVGQIGDSLANMLTDNKVSFKDFLRSTLVMALDALEKMMLVNIAEAAMKGLVKGPVGWLAAGAKIIAIKAAFAVAKNAIGGGGGGKSEGESKGYSEGGYTGAGGKFEPAGIVHKGEYVIPQDIVRNPDMGPVIDLIEHTRRNDRMSSIDRRSIEQVMSYRGYSGGGLVNADNLKVKGGLIGGLVTDAEQNKVIKELAAAVNELISNNKKQVESNERLMKWRPKVYTELIKKDLDTLDHIEKNRRL